MTVSYAGEVPNGSSFGCFWKILWKWRGSVYKLVWRELLAYLTLYYIINLLYRFVLNEDQKIIFQKIRQYFGGQSETIPMSFVLGFYVSLVVGRWWDQYKLLPWPDTLALFISAAIPNKSNGSEDKQETGRLMRRNIMRYSVLAYVITLMRISLRVKRRFPSWQHLVDAGLMLESEKKIFEIMDGKSPMSKYWMPLVWATNIINRARKENLIVSDHIVQTLLVELSDIRRRLGALIGYDTVCVPLVYTQVVTLVLYTYFVAQLVGRQMIPVIDEATGKKGDPDLYFPLFTALQFCFYVGWLKVAEVLINPFGEDDDDIELNWLIDRHIKASYMIVDEMHEEHPELLKDQYWDQVVPVDLPYTVASEHYRRTEPKGSAEHYKIKQSDAMYANIIPTAKRTQNDDAYADYESVDTPMVERRKNWFSRQITRMGSVRSSSTAYSSGGVFKRNRQHSVYSSPEAGIVMPAGQQMQNTGGSVTGSGTGPPSSSILPPPPQKMSFYEKFVGRKSIRNQRQLSKQNSKLNLNGAVLSAVPLKNRPRIPTPDVTKEGMEKENRFNLTPVVQTTGTSNVSSGVALMTQQLATSPSIYPMSNNEMPVLGTLLLTPIKELESNSVNNTLHAGNPATAALAKSVLSPTLQAGGFSAVSLDLTGITNSPSLSRISLNNSSALPTTMIFPTAMAQTSYVTSQPILQNDILSVAITRLPASSMSTNTQSNNAIITELPSSDFSDEIHAMQKDTLSLSRSNSMNTTVSSIKDGRGGGLAGRQSIASTVGYNNQQLDVRSSPPTSISSSSAPSTLSKSKPEQKTGEVYV